MIKRSIAIFIALVAVASCGRSGTTPAVQQDLKTYTVTTAEVETFIEATGSVQPDLSGSSRIASPLSGTIGQIFVKVGDRAKKGQPLLLIRSPEVTDSYSSYLSTLTQLKQAERIYALNTQLFDIGAVTKNDLLNSESTLKQAKALSEGLRAKLHLYGCRVEDDATTARQSCSDAVTVMASIDGYVADIPIHLGDKVDASTPLMTIADPQNIVVVANIYDTDVAAVRKGSNVTFYVDAFPNQSFKGVIKYVSDISDMDSKTVKTFIGILNNRDLFKQNMFLKLKIEMGKRSLPVIPQSAMVYREGKFYVYCPALNSKNCEPKEIRPVREVPAPGKLMAIEGLKEGDIVVVSAINLEKP